MFNAQTNGQNFQRRSGPLGFYVKGIATGIGLISESVHAHKEKKGKKMNERTTNADEGLQSESAHSDGERGRWSPPPEYESQPNKGNTKTQKPPLNKNASIIHGKTELEEGDEEQWDLDDAQEQLIKTEGAKPSKRPFSQHPTKVIQYFIDDHPIGEGLKLSGPLAAPVILPQRRPKDRSRGFIRAYAPELMNAGIDQDMFLDFLETFNMATQASPWLNAINMAGLALTPLHLATGVSVAVSIGLAITVSVLKSMQSRKRYHTVMDQLNEDFFEPRGLYAMVLTWEPETDAAEVGVNFNESIVKSSSPPEGISKFIRNMKPSKGTTNGLAFTETSPLVFPALDQLADDDTINAKSTKDKIKGAKSFAGDYFDRRAQAKHALKNPDSQLVVGPKPTFTSRYSDPSNPTNSGDLLSLLTAGKVSMPARGGFGFERGFGGGYGSGPSRGIPTQYQTPNERQSNGIAPSQDNPASQNNNTNQHIVNPVQNLIGGHGMGPGQIGQGDNLITYGVKRIIRHHVLYLLIVNLPTEEEITNAKAFMEQPQATK